MGWYKKQSNLVRGFTIVELLIVVVVIAILAAIAIASYSGITDRAKESSLKSDLQSGATQLGIAKATTGSYPGDTTGLKKSDSTMFQYGASGETFCLIATSLNLPGKTYYITDAGALQEGVCSIVLQAVTAANCSTIRTRTVDARDNHTYWVQKLADNKCWMLTNLGYAGGGINTYGDVKTLTNGTGGSNTYTTASYYVVPSTTNYTTEPANPSTATDGTGQFGYLYNWCGAMAGQATAACANSTTPVPDTNISICPAGWRLPTGGSGSELVALNTAINGGSVTSDAGLRTTWLAQRNSIWDNGVFLNQGNNGYYWSATPNGFSISANGMNFYNSYVNPQANFYKYYGQAVRCVAV